MRAAVPIGERVRERDLAGLVDDEVVELPSSSGRAKSQAVPAKSWIVGPAPRRSHCPASFVMNSPSYSDSGLSPDDFLSPLKTHAGRPARRFSISASRLWMALWLWAAMPTRRLFASRCTTMRAPVHVLPVPGGPWTNRWLASSPRASAFIASRSGGLDPRARRHRPGCVGALAREDGLERRIAPVAGADRFGDAQDRRALRADRR